MEQAIIDNNGQIPRFRDCVTHDQQVDYFLQMADYLNTITVIDMIGTNNPLMSAMRLATFNMSVHKWIGLIIAMVHQSNARSKGCHNPSGDNVPFTMY
jgi:hypothetical protein